MGYSLCMMTDLQNGLIFQLLSVLRGGFLYRTTLNDL